MPTNARHDFNGDGRSDILWRNNAGTVADWLGQANGSFANNAGTFASSVPTNWNVVGTGDFNGDGRDDILWRETGGTVADWLGQANGSFVNNAGTFASQVATNWNVVGTGDFNGDGRDDILWRDNAGTVTDWLGEANGGFANNAGTFLSQVATNWLVVGTGDFNGDGRDDILWRDNAGTVTDWLGQANGSFVNNVGTFLSQVATDWQVVGTGDFNGDGRDDVLWRNSSGAVADWLGQANGGFFNNGANFINQVPTNWGVVGIGDYNGDGRDDILWRDNAGTLADWLGQANGWFVNNSGIFSTQVDTSWQVQSPDIFFSGFIV